MKETKYVIRNGLQKYEVSPGEILSALHEQATKGDSDPEEVLNEDLCGWSLIHATDESGVTRPFCIMRSLPVQYPGKYNDIRIDDDNMANIIMEQVYKLSKRRVRWLYFKKRIKDFITKIFPKKK